MNAVAPASFVPTNAAIASTVLPFHLPLDQLQLFEGWPPVRIEPRPVLTPRPAKPRLSPLFLRAGTIHLLDDWVPRMLAPAPQQPRVAPRTDDDGAPRSEVLRKLLQVLHQLARSGGEVPGNPDLAERIGVLRQTVARGVRQLEAGRYFIMEVENTFRRFVFPDGAMSGWGAFRKGHAPGPPRRTRSLPPPDAPSPPILLRGPPPPPIERLDLRAPDSCQFQTWSDEAGPPRGGAEPHTCGAPALRGESWCLVHLAVVSPGRARRWEQRTRRETLLGSTSLCCM